MEAFGATQWSGFKDFCQFANPTRVVAGRGLLDGAGFEFAKEGASRAILVTDEGIRATGLPGSGRRGAARTAAWR